MQQLVPSVHQQGWSKSYQSTKATTGAKAHLKICLQLVLQEEAQAQQKVSAAVGTLHWHARTKQLLYRLRPAGRFVGRLQHAR